MNNDTNVKVTKSSRLPFILLGIIAAVVVAVVVVSATSMLMNRGKWYKKTTLNGEDVSGQSLRATKDGLASRAQNYILTVNGRNGGQLVIKGADIALQFEPGEELDEVFSKQHKKLVLLAGKEDYEVEYQVTYDQAKLQEILQNSSLVQGSAEYAIAAPVSASVAYSKDSSQFEIVPEQQGNTMIVEKVLSALGENIQKMETEIDLTDADDSLGYYEVPEYKSDSEYVVAEQNMGNNVVTRFLTLNMGSGLKEKVTPEQIGQWIRIKNGKIKYRNIKIDNWVEKLCLKYKTVGKSRKLKTHAGKTITIAGGDYGWQVDYETFVKDIKKALKQELSQDLIQAYMDDPSNENKKAITIKVKAPYLNTAFQRSDEEFPVDWDTENYTELSLSEQMVYVYRKGKVAFSCHTISGLPVVGRKTCTGVYFVKEHRSIYTMKGADYTTTAKNWVRITWSGTGFHAATWQDWAHWTKDTYKTRGSHGCLNLSLNDSQTIFDTVAYREAVFMHY